MAIRAGADDHPLPLVINGLFRTACAIPAHNVDSGAFGALTLLFGNAVVPITGDIGVRAFVDDDWGRVRLIATATLGVIVVGVRMVVRIRMVARVRMVGAVGRIWRTASVILVTNIDDLIVHGAHVSGDESPNATGTATGAATRANGKAVTEPFTSAATWGVGGPYVGS